MNKIDVNFKDFSKCYNIVTSCQTAFWCKNCHRGHQSVWHLNGDIYCDKCLPKDMLKEKEIIKINQNQEIID